MSSLTIPMPLPPSANALTKNNRQGGRSKTQAYTSWLEEAGYHARLAWRSAAIATLAPPLKITVLLGLRDRRRDAGNCLKPIEDMLVKSIDGLPDDRWNDDITIRRDAHVPVGTALVTIESIADTS